EADPEFADLGLIVLFAGREQRGQLLVDDLLVHALAVIVDMDLDDPTRAAVLVGHEVEPDVDRRAAGIDAVLYELAVEIERRGELRDEVFDGLIGDIHQLDSSRSGARGGDSGSTRTPSVRVRVVTSACSAPVTIASAGTEPAQVLGSWAGRITWCSTAACIWLRISVSATSALTMPVGTAMMP